MAVAHESAVESHTGATGSASEDFFSFTSGGTANTRGVLIFICNLDTSTPQVLSVTYGGIEVPAVNGGAAVDTAGEAGRCTAYFLGSGVPTGPQLVQISRNLNTNELWAICITVTAAAGKDTAVHEAGIVLLEGDGTLAVQSVTDGSPGSNSVRYACGMSGLASPPAAGTGSTALPNFDTGNQVTGCVRETTAGQGARNVGFSSGTSDDRAFVHLAVKEVTSAISGALNKTLPLTLSSAGTVLTQGALSKLVPLALTASGAVTVSASLSRTLPLSLATSGAVEISGSLSAPLLLALLAEGAVAEAGTTGELSKTLPIALSAMGAILVTGSLNRAVILGLQASGSVPVTGSLVATLPIALQAVAGLQQRASLSGILPLALSAVGAVAVQASLTCELPLLLSAQSGDPPKYGGWARSSIRVGPGI